MDSHKSMEMSQELRSFFELSETADYLEIVERIDAYVVANGLKKNNMIYPNEPLKQLFHIETPFHYSKLKTILQRHVVNSEHCIYCNEHVSYKTAHNKTKKHLMYKELYELKCALKESNAKASTIEQQLQNRNLIIEELHYEIETIRTKDSCGCFNLPWCVNE
jgi:hypothetical protein